MNSPYPVCLDTRECFARNPSFKCKILLETYEHDGACPFCKSFAEYEKGLSSKEKEILADYD